MSRSDGGPPAGAAQVTVYLGANVVHTFSLTMPVLTIGRAPDNGLPLSEDPQVSRHHAELRSTSEGTILTDLGSANGTLVAGARIPAHQPYLLTSGTIFYIGSYGFVYEVVAPPQVAAEPAPDSAGSAATQGAAGGAGQGAEPPQEALPAPPPFATAAPEPAPVPPPPPPSPAQAAAARPAQDEVALPPPAPPPPPRATYEPPPPPGPLSEYLRDLPIIFSEDDFLGRYLMILESIWEPLERRQDHIDLYFDARTCPPSFLPWLASWLDPALETGWPEERLRDIVARAMDLYRWRGTRYGLARMIEVCTGIAPRVTEDEPFCFRVRLEVAPDRGVDRRLVEQLIMAQKPAHAGYVLEIAEAAGQP